MYGNESDAVLDAQESPESNEKLKRSLKTRHMNMIAIGGALGTGLFLASGASISTAGPGGALAAYAIIGVMVYFIMTSLGEMATYLPVSGSFGTYATRYVDPALGFAIGWNYWLNWAITLAVEVVAGALVMKFWFPDTPAILWSAIFILILFTLNYLSTRAYGESEYVFASIKVAMVLIFLIIGTLLIFGVIGDGSPGFTNWTRDDAPFVGGFNSIIGIFMIAAFSFQGTELVGIAAGESENPRKNVPKAINNVFWRILLFYIGTMIVIGFLLPSGSDNVDTAPVSRNAELDIQSQSQPQPDSQPMQTQLVTPSNDPGQVAPVEPEPVQEDQEQAAAPSEPQAQQPTGIEQQWRSYRVEPGKTLAQLFRDHNLPATDVYAMAQVEGAGKPLSNLQNGQMVQIRQNASGVVTGLTIDTGNGQQVLFTRQPDGSFIRAR